MPQACISTGLPSLDAIIDDFCPGLPRGWLTIIVGETGSGKTSLCEVIALNAATQTTIGSLPPRVGFANIEGRSSSEALPYYVVDIPGMRRFAELLVRPTFDLLIVDGIQYLEPEGGAALEHILAPRARQIDAILSRVNNPHMAMVLTWQALRSQFRFRQEDISDSIPSIPASSAHRASLILQVGGRASVVRVAKNRFGESGGSAEFNSRWIEIPRKAPEPEFDRSKIPTRFEREDVI